MMESKGPIEILAPRMRDREQVLTEYFPSGWKTDYVYLYGRPIAQVWAENDTIWPEEPGEEEGGGAMMMRPGGEIPQITTDYSFLWYHTDHLGTPVRLTNSPGNILWRTEYSPFGTLEFDTVWSNTEQNLRFPGQYHDRSTDLYYNQYRHYRPDLGRYLTPDPIGISGGLNIYSYAGQNPINYIDPYGLDFLSEMWGAYTTAQDILFPTNWVADELGSLAASLLPEGLAKGSWFGTGFGEEAVDYWGEKYSQAPGEYWYSSPEKLACGAMGWFASLWTEDNYKWTTLTLSGAYAARLLGPFTTRGLPKYPQRIRRYIRYDRPHHQKPHQWDGKWIKWFKR